MQAAKESASATSAFPWYALRVKSKHEQVAATVLRGKGYDPFLPFCKVRRQWSDRVREVESPLFPGYLFCRLDSSRRLPVLSSTGVVEIVGVGKIPAPIEDREIDAIHTVVLSGLAAQPWPFPGPGRPVRVAYGPLRGVEGVVTSVSDRKRLVVSLTLLQRSISVEMDPAWVAAQ
jgi:transcription antitermination factor NusG